MQLLKSFKMNFVIIILVFLLFRKGQRSDKMQSVVWELLKLHFNCFSSNFPKKGKTFHRFLCPLLQLIVFYERESWLEFICSVITKNWHCFCQRLVLAQGEGPSARKHVAIRALRGPNSGWRHFGPLDSVLHASVWRYPKSERNRIRNFFPIPNFSDIESDTFFDTKFFRYRNRYFFRYQNFPIPNPKPPKKWKSFETEKFRNRNVT